MMMETFPNVKSMNVSSNVKTLGEMNIVKVMVKLIVNVGNQNVQVLGLVPKSP